ncbi:GIY-YIG nuclease family protein [Elusimicrobiota bacterium]
MRAKYRRMLRGLGEDGHVGGDWSVYVACCGDGSYYTGVAKDVAARLKTHNAGKGAAYTRSRRPVRLLYSEVGLSRSEALVREARIKGFSRSRKEQLVAGGARSKLLK